MHDPDRIRAPYSPAADEAKGNVATVTRGVPLRAAWRRAAHQGERMTTPHHNRQGVTVALAGRDDDRPVVARCPVCRRAIVHGALTAGTIVVPCRHCRLPVAVTAESA